MTPSLLKDQKGFSPIELMIVILVIGILALISISSLNTSRARARDAKRLIDVRRIQTALEYYRLDSDGYPQVSQPMALGRDAMKLCDAKSGSLVGAQASCETEYMSPFPTDPSGSAFYIYAGSKDGYALKFQTEKDSDAGAAGVYYAHSKAIDGSPEIK